jgi:hypothetical protein
MATDVLACRKAGLLSPMEKRACRTEGVGKTSGGKDAIL